MAIMAGCGWFGSPAWRMAAAYNHLLDGFDRRPDLTEIVTLDSNLLAWHLSQSRAGSKVAPCGPALSP